MELISRPQDERAKYIIRAALVSKEPARDMWLRLKFGIDYVIPITPRRLVNAIQVAVPVRSVPPGGSRWAVTLPIADCGFPVAFFRYGLIDNWQSQIGNV